MSLKKKRENKPEPPPCNKGCRENNGIDTEKPTMTRCEVCWWVDNNPMEKLCYYCTFCQSFICDDCWDKPIRRTRAAVKKALKYS